MSASVSKPQKQGTRWYQIILGLQTGVIIVLIGVLILPNSICVLEASPVSDLINLQKAVLEAQSHQSPLLKSQIQERLKPIESDPRNVAYKFSLEGTENNWLLTCAHDDSAFYDSSGFAKMTLHLRPHSVFILSSADNSLTMVSPRGVALRYVNGDWRE